MRSILNLFDKVYNLCKANKISIAALERELGFANGSIKKWNSAYPSADRIARVAQYFSVSTDYLLGLSDSPTSENASLSDQQRQLLFLFDNMNDINKASLVKEASYLYSNEQYQNRAFTTGYIAAKGGDSETFRVKPPWEEDVEK